MSRLYLQQVKRLHEIPVIIISDCDSRFTAGFWESLQGAMGTSLRRSLAFHPQTDKQTERKNQVLEDMLRMCYGI